MAGPNATITPTELLAGPAAMYISAIDWAIGMEPSDTVVNGSPAASAWTDVGGTDGGLTITVNQSYFAMRVDQVPDVLGYRLTERSVTAATNLAQPTLEKLAMILNESPSASAISTGSGYKKYEMTPGQSVMFPAERAILIDGWAPGTAKKRRVILRRVTSIENVGSAMNKGALTVFPVTWGAMYVDNTTSPVKWVDEVAP